MMSHVLVGFQKRAGLVKKVVKGVKQAVRGMTGPKEGYTRVYHGTSRKGAKQIKKHGILPDQKGGISEDYNLKKQNKNLTFASHSKDEAKFYAARQEERSTGPRNTPLKKLFGSKGRVVKVDIPDKDLHNRTLKQNPEINKRIEETKENLHSEKARPEVERLARTHQVSPKSIREISLQNSTAQIHHEHRNDLTHKGKIGTKDIAGTSSEIPVGYKGIGALGVGGTVSQKMKDHEKKASGDMIDYFNKNPKKLAEWKKRHEKKAFWCGFDKHAYLKKRDYKETDIKGLNPENKDEVWTAKIDGAHSIVNMQKGQLPLLYSHRMSKKTGVAIPYNDKLPHIKTPSTVTAEIRAEVYAVGKDGKAVHPDVVTALLNRTPDNSAALRKEMGIKTVTALIDVDTYDGKDVSGLPFNAKRALLKDIAKDNKDFHLPALATTTNAKQKLLSLVLSGDHPQTKEGLVVHKGEGENEKFIKAKIKQDHDVYVRRIFKEKEDTKEGRALMAGGFWYAWTPGGAPVGKVGTGFDHAMKKDMLANPERYIGRAAKTSALSLSKNNVLVKPSFLGWHIDKNLDRTDVGLRSSSVDAEKKNDKTLTKGMLKYHDYKKQTIIVNKKITTDVEAAKSIAKAFAPRVHTPRETKQSFRFRQLNPERFDRTSFKTFKPQDGVAIVYGKLLNPRTAE